MTDLELRIANLRRLASEEPNRYEPDLAEALLDLSWKRSGQGEPEDAVDAAGEASELYRRLAHDAPGTFGPHLATALTLLGNRLADTGRGTEALAVTEEAVSCYRRFGADDAHRVTNGLATALSNYAIRLWDVDPERALDVAREAIESLEALCDGDPGFRSQLAGTRTNLGLMLMQVQRWKEAATITRQSVELYRELAVLDPGEFSPRLASSLDHLAVQLSQAGARYDRSGDMFTNPVILEEAHGAAQESVYLHRALTADNQGRFSADLAQSLNNLAVIHSQQRCLEDAVTGAREAADLYRGIMAAHPHEASTSASGLGKTLRNLEFWLTQLGRLSEAAAAAQEAALLPGPGGDR